MKVILIVGCLFFVARPAQATIYYVAAAGSDTNSGTSTGTPWQTVAKVNASSFSPGDSILFNRGNVWYGTSLTVPSSGSSGSPITFGAYGSGANPIIKGSTLLNTSGYILDNNFGSVVIYGPLSDSDTSNTDSATRNWRYQVAHANITANASIITITVKASATVALNITGAGIGPSTTAPDASSITRITWNGGNSGATVAAGATLTSDPITYSLSNTVDQIVTIYTTARNAEYFTRLTGDVMWANYSAPDQSQSASVTGYASGGNSPISNITSITPAQYTYNAALASAPVALWENGVLMALESSPSTVEGEANSWYYDGTYLYLHASDGSNVSSNGKAYSYVTSSSPTFTAWDNGKSWLIFDSVDQAETYDTSTLTFGGLYLTGSNNIVRNASFHDVYRHTLTIYTGATNNTIKNVTGYNSYGTAVIAIFGSGTTGNLVQGSTFYTDTSYASTYVTPGQWGIVVVHGGATGNTIDSCVIYSTAATAKGFAILDGDSGTSVTASHNLIYGPLMDALNVGSGGGYLTAGSSITFFGNLVDISQSGGVGMLFTGSTGSIIYNNTIYGPSNANAAISQTSTSTGTLVKNNIFWTGAYATVDASSESGTAYDYNDYFSASGTPFSWGGTAYSFANWKTSSSQDGHTITSNPLLTNGTARNFTLQSGSPAIGAGANLGSTYQQALFPSSFWPGGVVLANQNSFGSAWAMGAYVFSPNRSTLPLMGCCD